MPSMSGVVSGAVPEGFTASLLVMTFLSGVQLFFLGVIGEYLGRVYGEAKGGRRTSSRGS